MKSSYTRRTIHTRKILMSISIIAVAAWGGLLLFTRFVPPESLFAFGIVFALLSIALFCTLTPLIYFITRGILAQRVVSPSISHALRLALLISILIDFNLVLRVLHSWNFFIAAVSLGIIIVIELLALGGK